MTKKQIEAKIAKLQEQLNDLQLERIECLKKTRIKCASCQKGVAIKEVTFIQVQGYDPEPYNERHYDAQGQFICPHCRGRNIFKNCCEVDELRCYFKGTVYTPSYEYTP